MQNDSTIVNIVKKYGTYMFQKSDCYYKDYN